MPYLGVLGNNFKSSWYVSNQHLQICIIAKFGTNIKILKFGMLDLGIFGLEFENHFVIFENSAFKLV